MIRTIEHANNLVNALLVVQKRLGEPIMPQLVKELSSDDFAHIKREGWGGYH